MIFQTNSFFKSLLLLTFLMLFSFRAIAADEQVSANPADWYYKKIPPRKVSIFNDKFIQTEYLFERSDKPNICLRNCPYKYPVWDGTVESVNLALSHIGLLPISQLVEIVPKFGNRTQKEYTDPHYPLGEIILFRGKYDPSYLWKIIIRKR